MKSLISIILSLLILITSIGLTASSHICGGKKVRTVLSIGLTDVSCGMEEEDQSCSSKPIIENNCCNDVFQLIKNDEGFTQQISSVNFSNAFLVVFFTFYVELFDVEKIENDFGINDFPPPLIKDIPIFIQSFLI